MRIEQWKVVPKYPAYKVSDQGRVKSFKRKVPIILKTAGDLRGRPKVKLNNKEILVSQLVAIVFLEHKREGMSVVVDHVDNDHTNNFVENLQLITQRENATKDRFRKKTASKYLGVFKDKRRKGWYSHIYLDGKLKHLGTFETQTQAHSAYQEALKEWQDGQR